MFVDLVQRKCHKGQGTGTGAGIDVWLMSDAGADMVLDFTDAGFASTHRLSGAELETILAYVDDFQPDLLIMGNQRSGRGIAGRIRGSLNEQVLRRAGKPMLLMPAL